MQRWNQSRNSYETKFQILFVTAIWEGQNYQTIQSGTITWFMTIIKLLFFSYSIIHHLLFQKLYSKMKQKLAPKLRSKNEFLLCYITFHGFNLLLCRYFDYGHFFCLHNSRIISKRIEWKHLYQGIKHRFLVCISFWGIQNCYKKIDVIRSLFYRYIACNKRRVVHDNCRWQRLSMAVATEGCWVERLSCKRSRT